MKLEGWNHIPQGYGAEFALREAPWWLRVWFSIPFIDRFAYPIVVRRGHGWLSPMPGLSTEQRGQVSPGWRIRPDGYQAPGSSAVLR